MVASSVFALVVDRRPRAGDELGRCALHTAFASDISKSINLCQ